MVLSRAVRVLAAASVAVGALASANVALAGGIAPTAHPRVVGSAVASQTDYFTIRLTSGATSRDANGVAGYLRGFGLSVRIDAADEILFVSGTYGRVSAASGMRFGLVADRGRTFVLGLSKPAFPAAIASKIYASTIQGGPPAIGGGVSPNGIPVGPPSNSDFAFEPADIAKYYQYGSIQTSGKDGTGQGIALIVCGAVSTSDVNVYQSVFSLPSVTPSIVQVDGGSSTVNFISDAQVELLYATADEAAVTVYTLPNDCGDQNVADATAQIVADEGTKKFVAAIDAYGNYEDVWASLGLGSVMTAEDSDLHTLFIKGVTTFASNGDNGGWSNLEVGDPGVFYPGSDPWVIAVGTTMALSNQGTGERLAEYASYYGGGGPSSVWAIPAWQKGVPGLASKTMRNVPDVAFNGDCQFEYYAVYDDAGAFVCGSSFGASSWAGLLALVDGGRVAAKKAILSGVPSKLYAHRTTAGMWVDINSGCNGVYCAGTGFDAVSGMGAPDATVLYSTLVALP